MSCAVIVSMMSKTIQVYQNLDLVGEPTPANNRADDSHHPVEVGKIADNIQSFSLAPLYSAKQLREIHRRSIRRKLAFQRPSRKIKIAPSPQIQCQKVDGYLRDMER